MIWCMKRTNIYLDEEQTASLDKLAAQEGVSRAELIRLLLNRALLDFPDLPARCTTKLTPGTAPGKG